MIFSDIVFDWYNFIFFIFVTLDNNTFFEIYSVRTEFIKIFIITFNYAILFKVNLLSRLWNKVKTIGAEFSIFYLKLYAILDLNIIYMSVKTSSHIFIIILTANQRIVSVYIT